MIHGMKFLTISCAFFLSKAAAQTPLFRTPAEETGYSRYSQHEDVRQFILDLDRSSKEFTVRIIGRTPARGKFPGADLYLCVLTAEGAGTPGELRRGRPTVLIFASQHGNEQSGKEAVLRLLRGFAVGELKPLLRRLNLLVIPQMNPYGNSIDRRQNGQGLDLNRDHVKLEAPETRALHAVFAAWTPEVTLDVHEKGDDYYRISTGCVSNLNIHPEIQRFSRERIFPDLANGVRSAGYTWHEYLIREPVGSAQAAGAPERQDRGTPRETLVRYSTTDLNDGRNSLGIYETLSFIQEGASRHDLATLRERTGWQYAGILGLIEAVAANDRAVLDLVRKLRGRLDRRSKRPAGDDPVHMRMAYVRDPAQPEVVLQRFERPSVRSNSGSAATPPDEPAVVTEVVKNWFPVVESRLAVSRPAGYLVPGAYAAVVRTLLDHGIRVMRLTRDAAIDVEAYRVKEIVPAAEDYLAPEKITVEKEHSRASARRGDYYVPAARPGANAIVSFLEPQSEYGFVRYKMYGLVPKAGAVFPVMRIGGKGARIPLAAVRPEEIPRAAAQTAVGDGNR